MPHTLRQVSIHAPAWGATRAASAFGLRPEVSIHAPAWGATLFARGSEGRGEFQSTRPRGARPGSGDQIDEDTNVSIHAPAWGATREQRHSMPTTVVSIHAPAWGATALVPPLAASGVFQSTRPRGARHLWALCDYQERLVSIHAPAWGATRRAASAFGLRPEVSIHAPAWGATSATEFWRGFGEVSIHAPAWGATVVCARAPRLQVRFNPRARVGRDRRSRLTGRR